MAVIDGKVSTIRLLGRGLVSRPVTLIASLMCPGAGKAHLIAARQRREAADAELGGSAGGRGSGRGDHRGSKGSEREASRGGDGDAKGTPAEYLQDVRSGRAQMQRPSSDFGFGR